MAILSMASKEVTAAIGLVSLGKAISAAIPIEQAVATLGKFDFDGIPDTVVPPLFLHLQFHNVRAMSELQKGAVHTFYRMMSLGVLMDIHETYEAAAQGRLQASWPGSDSASFGVSRVSGPLRWLAEKGSPAATVRKTVWTLHHT